MATEELDEQTNDFEHLGAKSRAKVRNGTKTYENIEVELDLGSGDHTGATKHGEIHIVFKGFYA